MKAFISHSISADDSYVIPLLVEFLESKGYISYISSRSLHPYSPGFQYIDAHFFLGIITNPGERVQIVLNEFQNALKRNVPSILMVDTGLQLNGNLSQSPNVIYFDRFNPEETIKLIEDKITSKTDNNALAWILGGIAVLALLKLFENDK